MFQIFADSVVSSQPINWVSILGFTISIVVNIIVLAYTFGKYSVRIDKLETMTNEYEDKVEELNKQNNDMLIEVNKVKSTLESELISYQVNEIKKCVDSLNTNSSKLLEKINHIENVTDKIDHRLENIENWHEKWGDVVPAHDTKLDNLENNVREIAAIRKK